MLNTDLGTQADMALNLVDLARFPIADLDSGEGAAFLKECQDHMEAHGWCNREGYMREDALTALEDVYSNLLQRAEVRTIKSNIDQSGMDSA